MPATSVDLWAPRWLALLAFLIAAGGAGCDKTAGTPGGPGTLTGVTPSGTTVSHLRLTGNVSLGAVGETSQLQAIATLVNGDTADVTNVASWVPMTNPSVIRVSKGLVTADALGYGQLDVTYGGAEDRNSGGRHASRHVSDSRVRVPRS